MSRAGAPVNRLIPDCHLVFPYDAGHAIATERSEAFTEVVSDFFDPHDAIVVGRTPTVVMRVRRQRWPR
jgi:hypothetical protein